MYRHLPPAAAACVTMMLALAASACENGVFVATPASPSAGAALTASLSQPIAGSGAPLFLAVGCAVSTVQPATAAVTPFFDLTIVAIRTVDLHEVTLRLIDGSSVGGPSVTFPQAGLTGQSGTTIILAGTTRTFRLQPSFVCGSRLPQAIAADIAFVDLAGMAGTVFVSRPLP